MWLGLNITDHSVSDLIAETVQKHKQDNYTLDNRLLIFSNQNPIRSFRLYGTYIKGIFRVNRCPLQVSVEHHFATRTPKISEGILQAIYEAQDEEQKVLMDYQAYAGERVSCICSKVTIDQIQPYNEKYSLISIRADQTKARNDHPCIIPKAIAESILEIARQTGRNQPFPNHESLWKQITKFASEAYGVRLTSHYLRKRFHSIAQKTTMPVNDWDFLMGDKMTSGHEAGTYTLEDWSELASEYDKYLAPRLGFGNADSDPLNDPPRQDIATLLQTISNLNATISDLRTELNTLKGGWR